MTGGRVTVDKEYAMTTVELNNVGYKDEPFIHAADVSQVFYVKECLQTQREEKMMTTRKSIMSQSAT